MVRKCEFFRVTTLLSPAVDHRDFIACGLPSFHGGQVVGVGIVPIQCFFGAENHDERILEGAGSVLVFQHGAGGHSFDFFHNAVKFVKNVLDIIGLRFRFEGCQQDVMQLFAGSAV